MIMLTFIYTYILLQTPINPNVAVNEISTEYGLLGSLFIIVLVLLLSALVYISRTTKKQIEDLNKRLDVSEEETKQAREELMEYIKNDHSVFVEVIKNYSDNNDRLRVVLEKIIMKF